jgi:methylmalonyl-CoA epimerase
MSEQRKIPVTGARIDHLGIAVESIAAARGLYEALGLRVTHEETVEHEGVRTAMIPLGESRVELLEPLAPETTVGRFLSKRGAGLHHVALHVDNIEAAWAELQAREVIIVSPAIQTGAGGHLYFFVHPKSTGGVLLEICQDPICQGPICKDPA